MRALLLRHGQTAGNLTHCYNGWTDEPLLPIGIETARAAGVFPLAEKVFVSPLQRARQTAQICFPNAHPIIVQEIQEMNFGVFEGRSADEMTDDPAYREWVGGGCLAAIPNGESIGDFADRVCTAFGQIVHGEIAAGSSSLFVVTHGGAISAIMHRFSGDQRDVFGWLAPNCGGFWCEIDEELWEKTTRFTAFQPFSGKGNMDFQRSV